MYQIRISFGHAKSFVNSNNFISYVENCPNGFSLEDIFYNDNENIYANTMHGDYLKEIFPHIKSYTLPTTNSFLTCSKQVPHSVECPTLLKEDIKTTTYDFCCHGKLSKGETINFSASKESNSLESNKLPISFSNVDNKMSSLTNIQGTQTLDSTFNGSTESPKSFVESSIVDNINENNRKPISIVNKGTIKDTQTLISTFDENNKLAKSIVDSSNIGDTLGDSNENKYERVSTAEDKVGIKNKKLSTSKLFYEFDVFLIPNQHLLKDSGSDSSNKSSINNVNSYESENKIEESIECMDMDCNPNSFKTLWEPRLCYEVEISPHKDGRKLSSFNVTLDGLENEKNIDKNIKRIEIENEESQVNLNTNKEFRELCFEVNFNPKVQNDKGGRNIVEDKLVNKQNVNIKEIQNEENFETNSNIDSFSNSNVSSNLSEHSITKSNSIDYQLSNEDEPNIMPFLNVESDSLHNQINNQLDSKTYSSKQFTFNPIDPLFLNLYVNYNGHRVGHLKMKTKMDKTD